VNASPPPVIAPKAGQPSNPVPMLVVVVGVLLTAGAVVELTQSAVVLGIALLAAGMALVIVGATRVGARLLAAPQPDVVGEARYPARLEGRLDPGLSRWMWLVKWLLALPHHVALVFLWIAFLIVTPAAGLMILLTGRYPASLFQFTVGVVRWTWRVSFYATGALATDQYPPFTLARTDYPATFEVIYPATLSRWRVLVKSWLLAVPHLVIVGAVTGAVVSSDGGVSSGGSWLGLLVFVAVVILLFTGVYRLGLFDLVMGINRWKYRTIAYTALMSDAYPPFRLDMGGLESPATGSNPPRGRPRSRQG
jgi:hypothetical protein